MATIRRTLSRRDWPDGAEVYMRFCCSREQVMRVRTGVRVPREQWPGGHPKYPRNNKELEAQMRQREALLARIEQAMLMEAAKRGEELTARALANLAKRVVLEDARDRERAERRSRRGYFFSLYDEFLRAREMSESRRAVYRSLGRALHRYELHRQATLMEDYELDVEYMDAREIEAFREFYRGEWRLYDDYPSIYLDYPVTLLTQAKRQRPKQRGHNVTVGMLRKLRTFFSWLRREGYTNNDPFARYTGNNAEIYGTPYYLTIAERDKLADYDLSDTPALAVQRDIFIFQCLVGCRVSDLRALTTDNIVAGAVEYVPSKTRGVSARVVRVPLVGRAKEILRRYTPDWRGRLLPYISDQQYNMAIKAMLRRCGIERRVTVRNPTTGLDERRPICEVASSHMARRTFVGNLYRHVKDANLVSSLSGHVDGSRAFARYNCIDDAMKAEMLAFIE